MQPRAGVAGGHTVQLSARCIQARGAAGRTGSQRLNSLRVSVPPPHPPLFQLSCGSCFAFSTVAAVESAVAIATGGAPPVLSMQQVLDCGSGSCNGGGLLAAFSYITAAGGLCSGADYPYSGVQRQCRAAACARNAATTRVTGWGTVPSGDEAALISAIVRTPTVAAIEVTVEWQFYSGGVMSSSSCGSSVRGRGARPTPQLSPAIPLQLRAPPGSAAAYTPLTLFPRSSTTQHSSSASASTPSRLSRSTSSRTHGARRGVREERRCAHTLRAIATPSSPHPQVRTATCASRAARPTLTANAASSSQRRGRPSRRECCSTWNCLPRRSFRLVFSSFLFGSLVHCHYWFIVCTQHAFALFASW